jgi:predicted enzyme related to lactoylglutathione lyase
MSRPIHFEIHATDVQGACEFYAAVFGWTFEDWTGFAGMPYFGVTSGPVDQPGINGAIMQRMAGSAAGPGAPVNGAVLTIGTDDYDRDHDKIVAAGGAVALPKAALPGMAWQGYYLDTDGNVFGLHQPDPNAS